VSIIVAIGASVHINFKLFIRLLLNMCVQNVSLRFYFPPCETPTNLIGITAHLADTMSHSVILNVSMNLFI